MSICSDIHPPLNGALFGFQMQFYSQNSSSNLLILTSEKVITTQHKPSTKDGRGSQLQNPTKHYMVYSPITTSEALTAHQTIKSDHSSDIIGFRFFIKSLCLEKLVENSALPHSSITKANIGDRKAADCLRVSNICK